MGGAAFARGFGRMHVRAAIRAGSGDAACVVGRIDHAAALARPAYFRCLAEQYRWSHRDGMNDPPQ